MARTWLIGEVADRTGLTRRTLRHYDELGLLVPSARSWGDYRLYDEADLLRLLQIQNLKALGLGLPQIAEALANPNLDATATLGSHLAHLEERIASNQQLAAQLRSLAASSERSWEDVLDAIAQTRRQTHRDPIIRLRAALDPSTRTTSELLVALAQESDPGVQDVLIWALAQHPDAASLAAAQLGRAEPRMRTLLARLLGKAGDRQQATTLVELLDDSEPEVVGAAVASLARLAEPATAAALVALLGSGRAADPELLDALAAIGSAAIEPTINALTSGSAQTRAAAAELLGHLGESDEADQRSTALKLALADPDQGVRQAALLALAELGESGRPGLASMVTDPQLGGLARRLLEPPPA